jgi:hypothetical protein
MFEDAMTLNFAQEGNAEGNADSFAKQKFRKDRECTFAAKDFAFALREYAFFRPF